MSAYACGITGLAPWRQETRLAPEPFVAEAGQVINQATKEKGTADGVAVPHGSPNRGLGDQLGSSDG